MYFLFISKIKLIRHILFYLIFEGKTNDHKKFKVDAMTLRGCSLASMKAANNFKEIHFYFDSKSFFLPKLFLSKKPIQ